MGAFDLCQFFPGGVEGYVEIQAGFDCTLLLFGGLGVWVGGYFVL